MKKLLFSFAIAGISMLHAEVVDVNGSFEKCKPDDKGVILPEGWLINKGVSKKYEAQITKEPDDVRNGKFAMLVETEKGGNLLLMKWQQINVKPGDKLKMTAWAKGKGKVALGFITYGTAEGAKGSSFLGTAAWPFRAVASADKWNEIKNEYTISEQKRDNKTFGNLQVIPVICVEGDSEVNLDDVAFEVTRK